MVHLQPVLAVSSFFISRFSSSFNFSSISFRETVGPSVLPPSLTLFGEVAEILLEHTAARVIVAQFSQNDEVGL